MPNLFENMSAAQRKEIANRILDMNYESQKAFVAELGGIVEIVAKAESEAGRKKTAIANINACRSGSPGEREMIKVLEGNLTRAGISLDSIVEAPEKIDAIFASASRPLAPEMRMAIKSQLFKLGVTGK
jgi:hypothetical protein